MKAIAKDLEHQVEAGELSAVEASTAILDAFRRDFA